MFVSRQSLLSRAKMVHFLNGLEASDGAAWSLYVPPGLSAPQVKGLVEERLDPQDVPAEAYGFACTSGTGAVFLWSPSIRCLVVPPFPVTDGYFARGYAVGPLRSLLERDWVIALVLVRLGAYAVGLCKGERLITSKVGTGLIHGRQRQGGSSAQRFQLHRQKQIDSFLGRVCGHIQEKLAPEAKALDFLVYGGSRIAILQLQKDCPFLRRFDDRLLPPLLGIPDPRQAVLEAAVGRVWSSRVIQWHDIA